MAAEAGVDSVFGAGWSWNYGISLDFDPMDSGGGGGGFVGGSPIALVQESGAEVLFSPDGSGGWTAASNVFATLSDVSGGTDPVCGSGASWKVTRAGVDTFCFDGDGRLTSEVDRDGQHTSLSWPVSGSGTLTITDGTGQQLSVVLGADGHASSVTDSAGRSVIYRYDLGGWDLVSVSSLAGGWWEYSYDGSDEMTAMTDPGGGETVNRYDAEGRVVAQWDPVATAAALWNPSDTGSALRFDYTDPGSGNDPYTTTITDPTGRMETEEFQQGYLVSDTLGSGSDASTTSFTYDPVTSGGASVTDPSGNMSTMTYTAQGWLASSTDPLGNTTTYSSFDAFGNPWVVTDPAGVTTTLIYDTSGNPVSSSTPWNTHPGNPAVTSTTYGDTAHPGDVTQTSAADGTVTSFVHDPTTGQVTQVTDPDGVTTFGYDLAGHQVWSVSPAGNASGGVPLAHRSVAVVNPAGEVLESLDANGSPIADGFVRTGSSLGNTATGEAWTTLAGGFSTTNGVASSTTSGMNLASVPGPGDPTTVGVAAAMVVATSTANGPGVAFRVQDANNYWSLQQVPAYGAWALYKTVAGVTTLVALYATPTQSGDRMMVITIGSLILAYRNGVLLFTTTSAGAVTDTALDTVAAVGLIATGVGPVAAGFSTHTLAGGVSDVWFNYNGQPVKVVGPRLGWTSEETSTTDYDPAGRPVKQTDGNGNSTTTEYDLAGRMVTQRVGVTTATPSGTGATTYGYDDQGRLASTQASGKPAETISYSNGDGTTPATKVVTEPSGATVTTTMEADGRPVTVAYSDGTPTVTYTYDADGRVTAEHATGSSADVTSTFDSLGQLTAVTRASRLVTYTYSAPGRVSVIKYPFGQQITRGYDTQGRWNSVTDWNNQTTTYGYDTDGNIATVTGPNGVITTRSHDADGAISHVSIDKGTTNLANWVYSRDQAGNLTGLTATGVGSTQTWAYDQTAQLTNQSASPTEAYAYDQANQPITIAGTAQAFNASGEICWTATTAAAGTSRVCGSTPTGAKTYAYNANGQRTSEGAGTVYQWNAAGELTSSTRGTATAYFYDPSGLRVQATYSGQYHRYTWDDTAGVPELIGDQNPSHNINYLYGPDGLPFEQIDATTGTSIWLHQDATGSVRCTTNGSGTVTSTETWTPWGKQATTTGTPPGLGYDSEPTDPSGLIYLQARYYDPATTQFLSVDPLAAATGERYGYTNNNPLNGSDPTGLSVFGYCISASAAAIFALDGSACIVTDGIHAGVLTFAGAGTGSPEAGIEGTAFMSTADTVSDLTGVQLCSQAQLGEGLGAVAEFCTSKKSHDVTLFIGGGPEILPAVSYSVSAVYAKYYSWSTIFDDYLKRVFGCESGPPQTRYHRNSNGSWGSGGASPNMDGNGLPMPPIG